MIYLSRGVVGTLRKEGSAVVSLDLGMSFHRASFSDLEGIPLDGVKGDFLYAWDGKCLYKLAAFDQHFYRLRMLSGKPILEIDGVRMHLARDFADVFDYSKMITRILRIGPEDEVLDTCTGLGYTAIAAAKKARGVVTIERSRAVLALAEWNPWSRELFTSGNIRMIKGDAYSEVPRLRPVFTKIIHDPPRFSHAGRLYSAEFYRRLASVSRKGALLFHYFGSLRRKSRDVSREVRTRLSGSGWEIERFHPGLQGCTARKIW